MIESAPFQSHIHPKLVLDRGRVFAWAVACDAIFADLVARLGRILNRVEIVRAEQFRFAADHTSFVVAHAVPRLMALQHRPASQWDLESDAAGRPLLRRLEKHDTLCGRLLATERGGAAALLMYDDARHQRISVLLRPMTRTLNAPKNMLQQDGVNGCAWIANGLGVAVVAAIPKSDIERVVKQISADFQTSG